MKSVPFLAGVVGQITVNQWQFIHQMLAAGLVFAAFALPNAAGRGLGCDNLGLFPQQEGSNLLPTPGLNRDEIMDGWLSLFDGKTLFGWKPVTQANWTVADNEIRVDSGERGLLRTTTQFDDFELVLEFKAGDRTNSGIFLRTSPDPRNVNRDCYELNIANRLDHEFPTGSLVNRAASNLDFESDRWHHLRVLADGALIKVWINDQKTVEYHDPEPLGRGFIGLQLNSGPIAFRNIRLKPINMPTIQIDEKLTAWETGNKMESDFSVNPQKELRVTGGRGQLETKQMFGDFIFSLQCKTNASGLNSGIFFRCIPGDIMNGYESQIQNEFRDDDRSQPVDCGTGGIFRRVNARSVNANDKEWFAKTIFATGGHVGVWVNGAMVTDWTDQRKPDKNPRKGRRIEAGTIMIQGHDPTTDLLFRKFKGREIHKRGK